MTDKKKRRRPSNEVLQAVKLKEDKLREEAMQNAPVQIMSSDDAPKISFEQWWMTLGRKIKLRHHLKEILLADFKARGAGKMESEAKYDELLRLFGYKW